ncbi:MAG: glutamate 5-kinase [Spirochaetia bacterium]|nr:glutamate 5-kinase [Spirochaetota bacterium]MCX8097080.1 glutamate 5-kinase [Spirochaetota bacterium]MDW8113212.1 glutamate 5-kinase [Spirochaetia bacterium]
MLIVVKIGTKIVLNEDIIDRIVVEISKLVSEGNRVVVVSSGAIGLGRRKLGINDNLTLSKKQALSSVGQVELMKLYQNLFSKQGLNVAQILLTYSELTSRKSLLNLINTINELFKMNIIPVINENDAVAVEEIKFGNNDILASLVATTLQADKLVILTDVDGLFKDFGSPNQELVREIRDIREVTRYLKGKKFELSTGGMKSKLQAGFTCMKSGVECVIANGFNKDILNDAVNGITGTKFIPDSKGRSFKDRLLILARKKGSIIVDNGAVDAIRKKKSLLPVGVKEVKGKFSVGDPIFITDLNGNNIAIGITNYSSSEVSKIKGKRTYEIEEILGTTEFDEEVIHIDNMVIL